jgi:two-component system sensor histidine kinase KdpD
MQIVKNTTAIGVSLAVVAAVTALLWYMRTGAVGPHHLIFFYLLPIALVAVRYGVLPAMISAAAAVPAAAFFLYDPIYSFYVTGPLETGELICFAMLASIGVKCTVELSRPPASARGG